MIENSKNEQVTRVYKLELNEIFQNVEQYFQKKSIKLKKNLDYQKTDYKKVRSKIDSG